MLFKRNLYRYSSVNNEFACASIFQSQWSYDMNLMLGYKATDPYRIVNNAVDEVGLYKLNSVYTRSSKAPGSNT